MKDRIYHLSTCKSCQKVLAELDLSNIEAIDIKSSPITAGDLDYAQSKVGSYEALFNKRAMKYRSTGLNKKELSEGEWRDAILSEYTYMKRPLAIVGGEVYTGYAKKVVEALKETVNG